MSAIQDGLDALNQIIGVAQRRLNLSQDYSMNEAAYQWLLGRDDAVCRACTVAHIEKPDDLDPPIGVKALPWTRLWHMRTGTGCIIVQPPDQCLDAMRIMRNMLEAAAKTPTNEAPMDESQPAALNALSDDARLTHLELASKLGLNAEMLHSRLRRWRKTHLDDGMGGNRWGEGPSDPGMCIG